jgi:tetratricopeptide (TPR) repeat protein
MIFRIRLIISLLLITILFPVVGIALTAKDSLLLQNKLTESTTEKINILLSISKVEENQNADSALYYAEKAYNYALTYENLELQTKALVAICRIQSTKNNFITCVNAAEKAIDLAKKTGQIKEEAIAKGILAIVYAETGNYDKSASYYFDALKLFEKIGDKQEIGLVLGNIGADLMLQRNFDKALEYMNKSLEISRQINDKQGIAQQYNNMAGFYLDQSKDYPKAMEYFQKAKAVNLEINDRYQTGINLINIGSIYRQLNQPDSALHYYQQALNLFTEINHPLRKADGLLHLSRFYNTTDLDLSRKYAHEALEIGQHHHSLNTILEASSILNQIFLSKGDTSRAYFYSDLQHNVRDSLYALQNQKAMFKLEFQYNQEKIEGERRHIQQRNGIIYGFVFFGLVTGIVIVLLINSRQRIKMTNTRLEKDQMESMLSFKNKELTINLMALLKKNEMLEEITERLISIEKKGDKKDAREAVALLNKELKQNIDDKIWKEFSARFNETNHIFYDKLLQQFPQLTQSELKLCAYLRLNMSTKDISELTGQRTDTIDVARYRLRKKLGISNSDSNLVTFLTQI